MLGSKKYMSLTGMIMGGPKLKKISYVCSVALLALMAFLPRAALADMTLAEGIGNMLLKKFAPESIYVTMSNGGGFAWAEVKGAVIDDVRVESLKMRALLTSPPEGFDMSDENKIAELILSSKGEAVLLEKDVNSYFGTGVDTKGFSHLKFDFLPEGYTATGIFSGRVIIPIRIRLKAKGILALERDGIYLDDTAIYVEGVKQPASLTNMIVKRVNPLLPFSKIPFPVDFNRVEMTDDSVIATSDPEPFEGSQSWKWSSEDSKENGAGNGMGESEDKSEAAI